MSFSRLLVNLCFASTCITYHPWRVLVYEYVFCTDQEYVVLFDGLQPEHVPIGNAI